MNSRQKLYYHRIENHICVACGKTEAEPGRTQCHGCLEKKRKYQKERYEFYKKNHICTRCHKRKAEPGKSLCFYCSAEGKEDFQFFKENHICISCRKNHAAPGNCLCELCAAKANENLLNRYETEIDEKHTVRLKKMREYNRKRYRERKAKGLCVRCGKPVKGTTTVCCKKCLAQQRNLQYRLWHEAHPEAQYHI